jgi:hypothetical protein
MFEKKSLALPKNKGEHKIALNVLKDLGYSKGLTSLLCTNMHTGIIGDLADIERRQKHFGKNSIALPSITPFHELMA